MLATCLGFLPHRVRSALRVGALGAAAGAWLIPRAALAQPLRPLPPPEAAPPAAVPPPALVYVEPPPAQHAPKYSLYVGGRLGVIGFGGNFFDNQLGHAETTGNFAKSGASLEGNIGARLGKRYIPYVALELSVLAPGHRFDGADTKASSSFLGIGFRYVAGDVDTAGFLTDLSFGIRTVSVVSAGQTYKMSSIELFRLGLGAEIRLSNVMTLAPMFIVSGGAMTDTQGDVPYGPGGQGDGVTHPTYANGNNIDQQRGYLVVGLALGTIANWLDGLLRGIPHPSFPNVER